MNSVCPHKHVEIDVVCLASISASPEAKGKCKRAVEAVTGEPAYKICTKCGSTPAGIPTP